MGTASVIHAFILEDFWTKVSEKCCTKFPVFEKVLLFFVENTFHFHRKFHILHNLWTLRTVSDTLNKAYAKFYNPSEHFAVDKITVKFKDRVIFQ